MNKSIISQLFIYPVKSLRGIAVKQAEITPLGFKYDRHWMIIDHQNKFVTQRKHPQMVTIKTLLNESSLRLSKQGMPDIEVDLELKIAAVNSLNAIIWKDTCEVIDEGDAISAWLTKALTSKKTLRLVRMAHGQFRPQSKPERFGKHNTTQFADAVSYLICNQNSLDKLNKELTQNSIAPSNMEQFRPNIVLSNSVNSDGLTAFSEHQALEFVHRDYTFTSCDPCQRCIVPTINLETGKKHPHQEPYKTLVQLNPMPNQLKAPAFGQNATLKRAKKNQLVKIDDPIKTIMA